MKRWQASTALLLGMEGTVFATAADRPASLVLTVALAAAWGAPALPRRAWPWMLAALLLTSWTLAATQGLFWSAIPRTPWIALLPPAWFPFGNPPGLFLYREGVLHGLLESLRGHALLWLAAGLVCRYGAEELVRGLRGLGLPGAAGLLAVLAVRQMPVLAAEARTAWTALRLKGLGPLAAVRALGTPLLTGHLRRADEIAAALQARGLGAGTEEPLPPAAPAGERAAVWICGGAVAAGLGLVALARLHPPGGWFLPGLEPLYAWVLAYV